MRHFFAALLAALSLGACGDGGAGPSDVIAPSLAGSWDATPGCVSQGCGFTFVPLANDADSINVVAFVGLSMEVSMTRGGRFEMVARPGDIPPVTGSVIAAGSTLIVRDGQGVQDTIDFTLGCGGPCADPDRPTRLTLRFRGTFTVFDFDGDGQDDPAIARGLFFRR